ncbi:hypothetical protein RSOLAG1IB_05801 [Rhizoctonia solani AG-1 IB]|uniref:G-patch domain-containing protein n=1 Tax=Thanatephorus cucumeris (strain AG1-IB / isolate 7/3/14) TaxID=1108050 RepID=A0A0B7F3I0_THACB|nr:hypothetical protein RSOLAG1IB_05801 [Rhizoctonia solani AG-1 IB]
MSDEEDDYLSEKFLASLEEPKRTTSNHSYAERRRIAQRESERKRLEGRIKSRREMEEEARREGLSRSLFEKEGAAEGEQPSNKAMSMMLKMGFKPGESLGRKEEPVKPPSNDVKDEKTTEEPEKVKSGHLTEPLPLAVWAGRKGLGLGKRAMSPPLGGSSKAAKTSPEEDAAEKSRNENFRAQARSDYEERRDEGRLRAALRTCTNLDESYGVKFNVLQLNPSDPSSIPESLYDSLTRTPSGAIEDDSLHAKPRFHVPVGESEFDEGVGPGSDRAVAARLKEQMKADSLRPLKESNEDIVAMRDAVKAETSMPKHEVVDEQIDFDQETVDAAREYLQKNVQERLAIVLDYLRTKHFYCFWNPDPWLQQWKGNSCLLSTTTSSPFCRLARRPRHSTLILYRTGCIIGQSLTVRPQNNIRSLFVTRGSLESSLGIRFAHCQLYILAL